MSGQKHAAPNRGILTGRKLGRYLLGGLVGQGGMGAVYRARQAGLDREVAIKVLGSAGGQGDVRRFVKEARAVARLRHPGIVAIHEVAKDGPFYFYSMDLIEGETLADVLDRAPMEPARAAKLLVEIASAVQHAHENGIIHRDLKPRNILLDRAGRPVVADFGVAKDQRRSGDSSMGQDIIGTVSYMAPEQAMGRRELVGPRTDVYGLGAILYECLTGVTPHHGDTISKALRSVLDENVVPPSTVRPGVPPALEAICLKALNRTPARRYPSAEEFGRDLDRFLRGQIPVAGRRTTRRRLAQRPERVPVLRKVVAAAAAVIVVAALTLGFALAARGQSAEGVIYFVSDREGAQRIYMARPDGSGLRVVHPRGVYGAHLAASPIAPRIAFHTYDTGGGDLYAVNADGSCLRRLTTHRGADLHPSWSPDGTRIAFVRSTDDGVAGLWVAAPDGTGARALVAGESAVSHPSWSPDGRRIAYTVWRHGTVVMAAVDLTNGLVGSFPPDGMRAAGVPQRRNIAQIYVMDLEDGSVERLSRGRDHDLAPQWAPDGSRIVFESHRDGNAEVYVMDADGGNAVRLTDHAAADREPVWSPCGRHIAFVSDRDGNDEVYVIAADGSSPRNVTNSPAEDRSPAWARGSILPRGGGAP